MARCRCSALGCGRSPPTTHGVRRNDCPHLWPDRHAPPLAAPIAEAVIAIASAGGYTGKSPGGPTGSVTLGLERVALTAVGNQRSEPPDAPSGPKTPTLPSVVYGVSEARGQASPP